MSIGWETSTDPQKTCHEKPRKKMGVFPPELPSTRPDSQRRRGTEQLREPQAAGQHGACPVALHPLLEGEGAAHRPPQPRQALLRPLPRLVPRRWHRPFDRRRPPVPPVAPELGITAREGVAVVLVAPELGITTRGGRLTKGVLG